MPFVYKRKGEKGDIFLHVYHKGHDLVLYYNGKRLAGRCVDNHYHALKERVTSPDGINQLSNNAVNFITSVRDESAQIVTTANAVLTQANMVPYTYRDPDTKTEFKIHSFVAPDAPTSSSTSTSSSTHTNQSLKRFLKEGILELDMPWDPSVAPDLTIVDIADADFDALSLDEKKQYKIGLATTADGRETVAYFKLNPAPDYITIKHKVMVDLELCDFTQNPAILAGLLSTNTTELIEETKNPFWKKWGGKITEEVRAILIAEYRAGKIGVRQGLSEAVCRRLGLQFDPRYGDSERDRAANLVNTYLASSLNEFSTSPEMKNFLSSLLIADMPKRPLQQVIAIENKARFGSHYIPTTLRQTPEVIDSDNLRFILHRGAGRTDLTQFSGPRDARTGTRSVDVANRSAYDCARSAPANARVLVVNFADPSIPGGNFQRGVTGREASMCVTSLLGASLTKAANKYGAGLNENVWLYTPDVRIVRDDDLTPLAESEQRTVDVMSVSAYNFSQLKDQAAADIYMRTILRNVFLCAEAHGVDVVVTGALGCGRFGNDPIAIANMNKELLSGEFKDSRFSVVYAILSDGTLNDPYSYFKAIIKDNVAVKMESSLVSSSTPTAAITKVRSDATLYRLLDENERAMSALISAAINTAPCLGYIYRGQQRGDTAKFAFQTKDNAVNAKNYLELMLAGVEPDPIKINPSDPSKESIQIKNAPDNETGLSTLYPDQPVRDFSWEISLSPKHFAKFRRLLDFHANVNNHDPEKAGRLLVAYMNMHAVMLRLQKEYGALGFFEKRSDHGSDLYKQFEGLRVLKSIMEELSSKGIGITRIINAFELKTDAYSAVKHLPVYQALAALKAAPAPAPAPAATVIRKVV